MNSALAIATPSSASDAAVADSLDNSTAPTDYYYHVVAVIEFRLRELLDDRLSAPDPESPISLKELDAALRSVKSAVDARRKIAQLEKQTNQDQSKPIQTKSIQPKTAQTSAPSELQSSNFTLQTSPTPPATNPETPPTESVATQPTAATPTSGPSELHSSNFTLQTSPTPPALSPATSVATHTDRHPESPTSVPSELHSSKFTLQNSSSPPASRFQISEAARIRFLKERRHQLAQKSRKHSPTKGQSASAQNNQSTLADVDPREDERENAQETE